MPHGRIGHPVDQRTDCFFPPLYPPNKLRVEIV